MILSILSFLAQVQDPFIVKKKTIVSEFHRWAPKPPLGWNSWDCYGASLTEEQYKENVEVMASKLKPFGWQYAVIDVAWYEPNATKGFDFEARGVLTMDGNGRLIPTTNKFPSSAKGIGFKDLTDWVHQRGLKFGIHLMRGVPRVAAEMGLPILGTKYKCSDIADTVHVCTWNSDMYGVDMNKQGAQEYYDSVFKLIASWGVDFVKVDDLSRPYEQNKLEVEAIRKAIDKTHRPIILSLSPGETALGSAGHALTHANMWRISDDFWDSWPALKEQFVRLRNWNEFMGFGHFPDADMLPLGTLANGTRQTNFTRDEQHTLMSLWAIARSPLILGGDMAHLDSFTESLLTNKTLMAINQNSTDNKPFYDNKGIVAWSAKDSSSKDRYAAIFNLQDQYDISNAELLSEGEFISRQTPGQGHQILADLEGYSKVALAFTDTGDGFDWDHSVWVNPTVELSFGTKIDLSKEKWKYVKVGYGEPSTSLAPDKKPLSVAGVPVTNGIFAHAPSIIVFDLPAGAKTFSAFAALNDSCMAVEKGSTVQPFVFGFKDGGDQDRKFKRMSFDLGAAGAKPGDTVTDVWTGETWKLESQTTIMEIPWHGVRLLKISS